MSEIEPEIVTELILLNPDTATTEDKFNPEVVDQFLRISGNLPAEYLKNIVKKIHDQKWVKLMSRYSSMGYEYESMFEKLSRLKDFESLIILAEAVLDIKKEEDINKDIFGIAEKMFYINDLSYTKVFEYLINIGPEYQGNALSLVTEIFSKIIIQYGKNEDGVGLEYKDAFGLYDVDIFYLKLEEEPSYSRDDVRELGATIKILIDKITEQFKDNNDEIEKIYKNILSKMPECVFVYKLNLYFLSSYPELFANELKKYFDRFETDRYYDFVSGSEYETALTRSFSKLDDEEYKEDYAKRVITFFKNKYDKSIKDGKEQIWHMNHGSNIISSIYEYIKGKPELIKLVEENGFSIKQNYISKPSVSRIQGGVVRPQSPITKEEVKKMGIEELVKRLKNDLTPQKLHDMNSETNFLTPINAEGVGEIIVSCIKDDIQKYINDAKLFFDPDNIDAHYLYSLLKGIEGDLKDKKNKLNQINFEGLFVLFDLIVISGDERLKQKENRDRDFYDSWLANWNSVFVGMTDILQVILVEDSTFDFKNHRDSLLKTLDYLVNYPSPVPIDEQLETAVSKTGSGGSDRNKYLVSDPFSIAINSVRGRAFQALVLFIYKDGEKLDESIKKIYESVLVKEDTRALMFMFGHYLPSFYYRDKEFIMGHLNNIFTEDNNKKHLYLAAWEGFLSTNLFKEIFYEPKIQELYKRGLHIDDIEEETRRHFKDPNDAVATHLALAYMFFDFGFGQDLFNQFWTEKTTNKQKAEFVHFLGSMFISGSNQDADKLLIDDNLAKDRLLKVWDCVLENYPNKEIISKMGMWFNLDKNIFEPKLLAEHILQTLEKTNGEIDWDYGLTKNITKLAEKSPEEVIKITKLFFIDGGVDLGNQRRPIYVDREWYGAIKNIYELGDETMRGKVYELIDYLIEKGGSKFWNLKNILES